MWAGPYQVRPTGTFGGPHKVRPTHDSLHTCGPDLIRSGAPGVSADLIRSGLHTILSTHVGRTLSGPAPPVLSADLIRSGLHTILSAHVGRTLSGPAHPVLSADLIKSAPHEVGPTDGPPHMSRVHAGCFVACALHVLHIP